MNLLLVLAGLAALFLGGEALVRGAVDIARRLALPPLLIGLTVVGFGTSTPELLVSLEAALRGSPDIAVGNVVGSNIANVLLILGLAALVRPIPIRDGGLRRDALAMVAASLALAPAFALGVLGRGAGAALLAGLAAYLVIAWRSSPAEPEIPGAPRPAPLWRALLIAAAGLVGLMLGARLLVAGATAIARDLGIGEAFIGLTIVAVGTSLPELAASLVAALRRQSEIALGNVLGSNVFNALGILGATALVAPIPVAPRFLAFDLPVMIAVAIGLAAALLTRPRIGRIAGGALLALYAAYIVAAA